jgi:hypothetical protein
MAIMEREKMNLYREAGDAIERAWLEREFAKAVESAGMATTDRYRARAAGITFRGLNEDPPPLLPRRDPRPPIGRQMGRVIPCDAVVQQRFAEDDRRARLRLRLVAIASSVVFVALVFGICYWIVK